jgi:replicative DNA helicase
MSSTQTNSKNEENNGNIKNESVIRGSRAIIDKCDIACIISRISREEEEMINGLDVSGGLIPNQVMDIYKVRRGKYTNVKIWSYVDLGTCRKKDLFITDSRYGTIEGFKTVQFMFEENNESTLEFLNKLNEGKVELKEEETEIKLEELKRPAFELQSKKGDGKFGGLY